MYDDEFKKLVGNTVNRIDVSPDKENLVFVCGDESFHYVAIGDCCSKSWFEHMTGVETLLGHTVAEIIERKMPDSKEDDDGMELTRFYGWTIITERGRCDIEMRNRSNGYYGGYVECIKGDIPNDMKPVVEDF